MSIATASSRTATASSRTATASSSTTEAGVGPRDRSVPTRTLLTGLLLTLLTGTAVIHASSAAADQHAAATALRAPTPYEATYQARARGMRTDAYRYLRATDDEIFEVSHGLSVSILGANLITVQETSQFRWADHGAMPLWYTFDQSGVRRRHEHVTFDWSSDRATVETDSGEYETAIHAGVLDNLSFSAQMSAELYSRGEPGAQPLAVDQVLTFQIIDGDEVDVHDYRIVSYETIETLVGELDTVRLARVREPDSSRSTEIWLASDHEFVLARLVQIESSGSRTELLLKSLEQTTRVAAND